MCGIFGLILSKNQPLSADELLGITNLLFKLSESRGKEASGIAVRVNDEIYVYKEPLCSSKMVKSEKYRKLFETVKAHAYTADQQNTSITILGHSRLQTNGLSEINLNNQPVVKDGAVGIHNGIIVNDQKLWLQFTELKRNYDVDTEVLLGLIQLFRKQGASMIDASKQVFQLIEGSASIALTFTDDNTILLATNTGSLYTSISKSDAVMVFASEKYIVQQVINSPRLKELFGSSVVVQVKAGEGRLIDTGNMQTQTFELNTNRLQSFKTSAANSKIIELYENNSKVNLDEDKCQHQLTEKTKQSMMQNWQNLYSNPDNLKRCTRCLLPETMPSISFDKEGVCSYCREYEERGSYLKGEKSLQDFVSKYRSSIGEADVLVGFSGGRDSSYGLDYIKNSLGLHPITFTYDWGMVNDLARRNQARVVGKLGIEHIVISADIRKKRLNIRKNLKAWLKRPDLGMVPILMAGDKQFYYYFHKIRKQTGIKLFIFCGGYEGEEGTGLFKYGFCNVNQDKKALKRMTGISKKNKLKIMYYYFKQFIRNPSYINKSMFDTLFAYYSSYVLPDDYLYLFHYIDWDENQILNKITSKFNWEIEPDTIATWRIDDGTAAFYNYIYMTMAGFTEFDIFRSHQIREGKLTRQKAFEIIKEENKPRFNSIEWYGQAINYDMNKAVEIINTAQKRYTIHPVEVQTVPIVKKTGGRSS